MASNDLSEHLAIAGTLRPREGNAAQTLVGESECRDLLRTKHVGRAVYTEGALPAVLPVNYAIVDDSIFLRVRPATPLADKLPGSIIALEVDELEATGIGGWLVVVTGLCLLCTGLTHPPEAVASLPFWAQTSSPWLALDHDMSLWRGMRVL